MNRMVPSLVSRARLQLMLTHPFMAAAVARYPIVNGEALDWCETMATDGYHIFVDPSFCRGLSERETLGVLAHEILHCVLGHIDRRSNRNRFLWNVAIDYATNLFLIDYGFELPRDALIDQRYRGRTAEDIYDDLIQRWEVGDMPLKGMLRNAESEQDSNERQVRIQKSHVGGDRHLDASDPEGDSLRKDEFPSELERRRIRISLAKDMKAKLVGRAAGYLAQEIEKANTAHIAWQSILARFFNGLRKNDYRMVPFNRKHTWREIYLPSIGTPGPEHIVVAIDTSGSMDAKTLGKVLAELDQLRSVTECKLTVIECDAVIHRIEEFQPWELSSAKFDRRRFLGRGGTDLRPPIDWVLGKISQSGDTLDALFYLTDGFGTMPDKPPPFPLFWVVPKSGREDFPFGQVLKL